MHSRCLSRNSPPLLSHQPSTNLAPNSLPEIWEDISFDSPAVKFQLQDYIVKRLTPHPIKLRADIEVQCFGYEGIDAVRAALHAAEAVATEVVPVKVRLVAPPLYVLNSLQCFDRDQGLAVLERAIEAVRESIEAVDGGSMKVVMLPKVVSSVDDDNLKNLMERRARENMEVSGDEDEERSDEDLVEIPSRGEKTF